MNQSNNPSELWCWTAGQMAEGIRTREISAAAVLDSCLGRIEQVNPALNALVEVRRDEAVEAAREADAAVAAGVDLGPLHGVPVSTKVNTSQRGHAVTHGVTAFADLTAPGDAACIQGLREGGAVLVGRSNTPTFSLRWFTDNALHGRTLNPWDPSRTPGGSSGGAASAVAAGMVPLAHGNDIGGSVRYPAHSCGLVGIRPTVGMVSGWEPTGELEVDLPPTFQSWAVHGPLARTVEDARLALHSMTTPDLRDPFGVPLAPAPDQSQAPGRVLLVRDVGLAKPQPAVGWALDEAAARLSHAGYAVEELEDLPLLAEASRLWFLLLWEDVRATLQPMIEQFGDDGIKTSLAGMYSVSADMWGAAPGLDAYIRGWARRGTLIRKLQEMLADNTIILTPVSAEVPFEHDADLSGQERFDRIAAAQWPMTCVPVLGFPAISVPTGLQDGLPTGVQLIGGRFREEQLLTAAAAIEAETPQAMPHLT
ncbi:amidase [Streptomyces griseoruber]|uniref:Amidase n=1 Tax=Streptomyces griseoruber TaxID=1943 RepID=A0A101T949_9ACTN|nr:amidase [Streptomyces griseoruber]KUN88117.1 amidase [Streptomyces griseoruber]